MLTSVNENPFASPQSESLARDPVAFPAVDAYEWYRAPTSSGLGYGAAVGAVLMFVLFLYSIIDGSSGPATLIIAPISMGCAALFGAMLGGLSGAAIGLIAVAVRRTKGRSVVHLLSPLLLSPLFLAGPLAAIGNMAGAIFDPKFQLLLQIVVAGGVMHGFLLFWRLCSVAKLESEGITASEEPAHE